ncbi:MAG: hypothetical protein HFACDABA_01638 [Anaerolineales bacterium]|nr:hypothetical protein [Anaerolineales bacterium]
MKIQYHREITIAALKSSFGPRALQSILRANFAQDSLRYQFGHDHFHFDSSQFDASYAYIEEQRRLVRVSLERGDRDSAWAAFGRLTHTVQDFYAHSNYISLWLDHFTGATPPPPPEVDPGLPEILRSPDLRSGKLYYPLEALTFVPFIGKFFVSWMPRDSHARMNHDAPENSPLFEYAYHAAVKRTRFEFEKTASMFASDLLPRFMDR